MRDHKSLLASQEAQRVTDVVFEGVKTSWNPFPAPVFSQLQRASLSVQLNVTPAHVSPLTGHCGDGAGAASGPTRNRTENLLIKRTTGSWAVGSNLLLGLEKLLSCSPYTQPN